MFENKPNRNGKNRQRVICPMTEELVPPVADCRYEGVEISEATIAAVLNGNEPIIEIDGILYLPIANVRGKKGPSH
ncbi:MAG TPA: hypothetical protein PLA03_12850 [Acidobacteriota bacterium]|mgnify:CR=1 FL=1|nr:hypothetical protein [Acidobacteriota bacterium]